MDLFEHADIMHLCHTLRYWGVTQSSEAIIDAAFGDLSIDWKVLEEEFGSEITLLKDLAHIRELESQ